MKNKENKKAIVNPSVCVSGKDLFFPARHSETQKTLVNSLKSFDSSKGFRERSLQNTSKLFEVSKGSLKNEMDEWLTSDEAACYLKVSKKTLLNMVSGGRIPYAKLGRSNRYLLRDLQILLFSEKRGSYNGN